MSTSTLDSYYACKVRECGVIHSPQELQRNLLKENA